jgi:hypothetical protein
MVLWLCVYIGNWKLIFTVEICAYGQPKWNHAATIILQVKQHRHYQSRGQVYKQTYNTVLVAFLMKNVGNVLFVLPLVHQHAPFDPSQPAANHEHLEKKY